MCGPWIAPARNRVVGSSAPAVEQFPLQGGLLRRVAVGAGCGGRLGLGDRYGERHPVVAERPPVVVEVDRGAGDHDRGADPVGEPDQLLGVPRAVRHGVDHQVAAVADRGGQFVVVLPVERDRVHVPVERPEWAAAATPGAGPHLPPVGHQGAYGGPSDLAGRPDDQRCPVHAPTLGGRSGPVRPLLPTANTPPAQSRRADQWCPPVSGTGPVPPGPGRFPTQPAGHR